jgi:HAD superfamily hydrolase (TIGR01450 family)
MDGTIYLEDRVLRGAHDLISYFDNHEIPYYFFTNNSSKSPNDYIEKLARLKFGTYDRTRIITSGDVTAEYLKRRFGSCPSAFVVGTPPLIEQLTAAGITCTDTKRPDCVLVAFDTTYHYAKAKHAVDLLRDDVPFLATNIDAVCPLDNGAVLPDCASICAMLTVATGKHPKYLGKPFAETAQFIEHATGVPLGQTAVIGDRLYTDMHLALDNGMIAIGVLSGEMTQQDIDASDAKPHFLFSGVDELLVNLQNAG